MNDNGNGGSHRSRKVETELHRAAVVEQGKHIAAIEAQLAEMNEQLATLSDRLGDMEAMLRQLCDRKTEESR